MKLFSYSQRLFFIALYIMQAPIHIAHASEPESSPAKNIHLIENKIPNIKTPNYRAIVDLYGPAVVGVTVQNSVTDLEPIGRGALNRDAHPPTTPEYPSPSQRLPSMGLGTGFIIDANGIVLTNAHVVRGADTVTVTLNDRREFKARVLGQDSATDIAVLKVDAHDLPIVKIGDAEQLRVGDYVLAIGTPYGFNETATSGIVSALHRMLPDQPYVPFIQTDAAVNPGNSGGPLFNADGEVVGINAQIYSNTGGYEGLAFSIPINLAKRVADQIIATGVVKHAILGVSVQQVTQLLADSFQLKRPDGALISRVQPHSAAARAGFLSGDIILACNGAPIRQAGDVSAIVGAISPDSTIKFSIWRNKAKQEITVNLTEPSSVIGEDAVSSVMFNPRLGLLVRSMNADEKRAANVSVGLLIIKVSDAAQKAGIQPGNLLLAINGTRLEDPAQLSDVLENSGPTVALLIQEEGERTYVPVSLDE